jgi:hypothetical protein
MVLRRREVVAIMRGSAFLGRAPDTSRKERQDAPRVRQTGKVALHGALNGLELLTVL